MTYNYRPDNFSEPLPTNEPGAHAADYTGHTPATSNTGTLEVPNRLIPSPAARRWAYGVLAAVGGALVVYGAVTPEEYGAWLSVAGAVLGIGGNTALAVANVPHRK